MPELRPYRRHETALLHAALGAGAGDTRLFPVRVVYVTASGHLCGSELTLEPGTPELRAQPLLGGWEGVPTAIMYPVRVFVVTADQRVAALRIDDPEAQPTRLPDYLG